MKKLKVLILATIIVITVLVATLVFVNHFVKNNKNKISDKSLPVLQDDRPAEFVPEFTQ